MSKVLEGKVAVITGAGKGLGQAFALKFAKEGADLFLTTTNLDRAQNTINKTSAVT